MASRLSRNTAPEHPLPHARLAKRLAACLPLWAGVHLPATAQDATGPAPLAMEEVFVSATRTALPAAGMPLAWSAVDSEAIDLTAAVHINEIMQRVPGTWISRGNGQESLTAIRSPVLTGAGSCGAFFMAWDGISLRAPGFCNVNQLFDVNSEQAGRIEVIRGPGTAVYGSGAMHGVINVLSAAPPATGERNSQSLRLEAGPFDYLRGSYRIGTRNGRHGLSAAVNVAHDGGYKDDSGFEQQKLTLRHDYEGDVWQVRSALEASNLNQETAGFIQGFRSYRDSALKDSNPNPEAYRDAWSLRAYSRWSRMLDGGTELSITPYVRRNRMEFLQHFFPWQPTEKNGHESLGLRLALNTENAALSWVRGIDMERTQGTLSEVQAEDFSPTLPIGVHYDYEVTADELAAYTQWSWRPADPWEWQLGARAEYRRYDYDNRTGDGPACAPGVSGCRFFRPADREDSFSDISVNAGLSYRFSEAQRVYARAARGFRAPETAELYRLQAGQQVADLDSERIDSIEVGWRGALDAAGLRWDLTLYAMDKQDVIFQDADRQNVSGARTQHRGAEISLDWSGGEGWYAGLDANLARHEYDGDTRLRGANTSLDGNLIDTAPRAFGSARVGRDFNTQRPLRAELEWVYMGRYYLDPDNAHEYAGHQLFNLRLRTQLGSRWGAGLRLTNLLDEDYAERADFGFGQYRYFVGQPRGLYVDVNFRPGA